MATLGDPLMDLGTALGYWVEADDPPAMQHAAFGPTATPGIMTRARGRRALRASAPAATLDDLVFYYAFGLFKTAVIAQQIYYRFAKGPTRTSASAR